MNDVEGTSAINKYNQAVWACKPQGLQDHLTAIKVLCCFIIY